MQLIVLGMHRSGTSVLARLLNMMGAYFGPEGITTGASQENPKGFWERRDVRAINDMVLQSNNFDWNKVANFDLDLFSEDTIKKFKTQASKVVLEMDAHRPWLLKEPRLCLTLSLWKEILEIPVCLHIFRNPIEVAYSLKKRNGIPLQVGIALWEKYNLCALRNSSDLPRLIVSHHQLMKDPCAEVSNIYKRLREFDVADLRIPSEQEINAFVDNKLYRERTEDKVLHEVLNEKQLQLYREFQSGEALSRESYFQMSEGGLQSLTEYEFNEEELTNLKNKIERTEKKYADVSLKLSNNEKELSKNENKFNNERSDLKHQIQQYIDESKNLKQKLYVLEAESENQNRENKKQLSMLEEQTHCQNELNNLLTQKDREHESLKNQLNEKNKKLKIQEMRLKDREKELNDKIKELAQQKKDIAALTSFSSRLIEGVDALLSSRRWWLGNMIVSLRHKLLLKSVPSLPSDYIATIKREYEGWTKKTQSRKATIKNQPDKIAKKRNDKSKKPYVPLPDSELTARIEKYNKTNIRKRIVVYTAIFGNYDVLKVPETLNPEYDYVCFTDIPIQEHPIWQFRYATYFNSDTTRIARYYKLHPHFYLKEYDIAIWVDANILIRKDINYLVDAFIGGDQPLGIFKHYVRDCTFVEGAECINSKKDEGGLIKEQITRYKNENLPENLGLPETNILISRPNDEVTQNIFNFWWRELDNGSRRDQISVMYALWKNQVSYTPLVDCNSKMARFDRNNFELFNHMGKTSHSHPSIYKIPTFLKQKYQESSNKWWELQTPGIMGQDYFKQYNDRSVDVIIPVHNALDDVKKCLKSVAPTLSKNQRLIIIDDGSETDTKEYLENFVYEFAGEITLIRHETANGYTKASNAGLKKSNGEYVVLLNSDTIVPPLWLTKLIHCAETAPEIGIVGPLSNAASWQSVPDIKEKDGSYSVNPLPKNMTVNEMDLMCQKYSLTEFPRVQLVNGFCFLIKRSVIKKIGFFDELSFPKGYNEENDYCFRASDAGFDLAVATHAYVYHSKSKSYTPKKRLLLCEESRKVFEVKYSVNRINRATESVRCHPLINKVRSAIKEEWQRV